MSKIKISYFTDPICSTCWIMEPYLQKLIIEYGHAIELENIFCGLLPDWEKEANYSPNVSNATYLADLWTSQRKTHDVVIDGDVWYKNPVQSSFPPAMAYYAALKQDKDKAFSYLRLLKEMLFLEGKDISKEQHLLTAAIQARLDPDAFLYDYRSSEIRAILENYQKIKFAHKINYLPSFIFYLEGKKPVVFRYENYTELSNFYKDWEKLFEREGIQKNTKTYDIHYLIKKYSKLTIKDLRIISNKSISEISLELENLFAQGKIIRERHNELTFWKYNKYPFKINTKGLRINKIAVIGGGVCGYTAGNILQNCHSSFQIFERNQKNNHKGFGFVLLENGIKALDSLGLKSIVLKRGNTINKCKFLTPSGDLINQEYLRDSVVILREQLLDILSSNINEDKIAYNCSFTKFTKNENQNYENVVFNNDQKIDANLFFGTDGLFSEIRKELFPQSKIEGVSERELVCVVEKEGLSLATDEFLKIVDAVQGKYMGITPLGNNRYIWFLQYNNETHPLQKTDSLSIRRYMLKTIKDYPAEIKKLIQSSNFKSVFPWDAKRMNHLDSYHKQKVVLAGDAAHPLLALTSQGANSAIEDAVALISLLSHQKKEESLDNIFSSYYHSRKGAIEHYIKEGDKLLDELLNLSLKEKPRIPLLLYKK